MQALSSQYETLFDQLLDESAGWLRGKNSSVPVVGCWTASGSRYQPGNGLMVLGRATNGYYDPFTLAELDSADGRAEVLRKLRKVAEAPDDMPPLYWVNTPSAEPRKEGKKRRQGGSVGSRSAFWRVTRSLLGVMNSTEPPMDWASDLAWGNLAKVAPQSVATRMEGANPSSSLLARQRDVCADIIQREVGELRPRAVLVVAGEWWYAPYAERLGLVTIRRPGAIHVRDVAVDSIGTRWIFTERPERKPQAQFVAELVTASQELGLVACAPIGGEPG